jgi:ubiquinone/menaquinone biosynthesis C-methylase UbiE
MKKQINSSQVEWWDQLAQKLDGYQGNYKVEFEGENGENQFVEMVKQKLERFSNAIDVGCADGKFTHELSNFGNRIIGVDLSSKMIEKAKSISAKNNLEFIVADGRSIPYEDNTFDLVISRRGPVSQPDFLEEAIRITRPGGQIVEITIGEKDAIEFKEIFNRGQGYTSSNQSRYLEIKERIELKNQIQLKELHEYYSKAIYPSIEDVILLLSATPIIDDFHVAKDVEYLKSISQVLQNERGITRTYHRLIWVAEKVL